MGIWALTACVKLSAELSQEEILYVGKPEVRRRGACTFMNATAIQADSHRTPGSGFPPAFWDRAEAAQRGTSVEPADGLEARTSDGARSMIASAIASVCWMHRLSEPRSAARDDDALPAPQVDEKCVSCGHRGLSFYTMQVGDSSAGRCCCFLLEKLRNKS